ncbi:MAG: hypothetical protein IH905_08510, partial [Proteobacteria bacterium]|nr:hypothetical protein [Pseudomonadota bacterium]
MLWTEILASVGGSLADLIPELDAALEMEDPSPEDIRVLLNNMSILLTRRAPPMILTRGRVPDRTLYRAVSSNGQLPKPDGAVSQHLQTQFDRCLQLLDEMSTGSAPNLQSVRAASVRMGGWCFERCPKGLRQHLLDATKSGQVLDRKIYFRAMGKVFVSEGEYKAFFDLLERGLNAHDEKFKMNEIEGFFYLLSLRKDAPLVLSDHQATLFACKL